MQPTTVLNGSIHSTEREALTSGACGEGIE